MVGVLLRFREGNIAVSADVAKMFYMIWVPKADSNFLRFVWFPNNDLNAEPRQYKLTVHVFGAKSSPSIPNFALHHCLSSHGRDDVVRNLYIDDLKAQNMNLQESMDGIPDKKGGNLLQEIKNRAIEVFVIVISGDIQPEMKQRVEKLGALDFIEKPVDAPKLKSVLERFGLY